MSRLFETNDDIEKIISNGKDIEKTIEVLEKTSEMIKSSDLTINDYRWQSLVNHITAMVDRSYLNERLEGFEVDMFSEISQFSLELAEKVVDLIGNLATEEKYLLSVHFETARLG